jgi:hypothetical protein
MRKTLDVPTLSSLRKIVSHVWDVGLIRGDRLGKGVRPVVCSKQGSQFCDMGSEWSEVRTLQ